MKRKRRKRDRKKCLFCSPCDYQPMIDVRRSPVSGTLICRKRKALSFRGLPGHWLVIILSFNIGKNDKSSQLCLNRPLCGESLKCRIVEAFCQEIFKRPENYVRISKSSNYTISN